MSCCGSREKVGDLRAEQKWDYINLDEFTSSGCGTPLSYGIVWIFLVISVAVYAVDIFTAVNLLAFDRWAGQIKPAIPFSISRWLFAGCIILSWLLLFYRWMRAIRVMKKGGVAQSYLDPLAVRIQSIRMGKEGRGWKRFLVFAALTKGKKGADYVALFTYFSFEAWLRVLFAEGPRVVINAITLYSVMRLDLIPTGNHAAKNGHSTITQFFVNMKTLADKNTEQAVVLFGMLFTLVIWVISIINLAIAVLLYVFFLWHHIPSADGGLGGYCRRKINSRMEKIVQVKVAKALKKENAIRARQGGGDAKRQPTLPEFALDSDAKLPEMPLLSRTATEATLPAYTSRPGTAADSEFGMDRQPTLPGMPDRPYGPSRSTTQASATSIGSYASNAPLLDNAGSAGYDGRAESPRPPSSESYDGRPLPPGRSLTGSTQASQRSYPGSRPPPGSGRQTPTGYPPNPVPRSGSAMSGPSMQGYPPNQIPRTNSGLSGPPMHTYPQNQFQRTGSGMSGQTQNSYQMGPIPRNGSPAISGIPPSVGRRTPGPSPIDGRGTPGFQNNPYNRVPSSPSLSGRGTPGPQPPQSVSNGYTPFNPAMRSHTPQGGPQGMPRGPPRSNTQPIGDYFGASARPYPSRSGTAPPPQGRSNQAEYDDILNSY